MTAAAVIVLRLVTAPAAIEMWDQRGEPLRITWRTDGSIEVPRLPGAVGIETYDPTRSGERSIHPARVRASSGAGRYNREGPLDFVEGPAVRTRGALSVVGHPTSPPPGARRQRDAIRATLVRHQADTEQLLLFFATSGLFREGDAAGGSRWRAL